MPTIQYVPNSNASEVDIRTGLFMYRFINKNNTQQREYIMASDDSDAKKQAGDDYMFAARFRTNRVKNIN